MELAAFLESPAFTDDISRIVTINDELEFVVHSGKRLNSIIKRVDRMLADLDKAKMLLILYVYDNGRIAYP